MVGNPEIMDFPEMLLLQGQSSTTQRMKFSITSGQKNPEKL